MFDSTTAPQWRGTDTTDLIHRLNEQCFELMPWMLDKEARQRASRFPFVIVDIRFQDAEWWSSALKVRGQGGDGTLAPVMHEALVLTWHTVKRDRNVARLSFGITPAVAEIIARLTPGDLAAIAEAHAGELRLRWQENEAFWRDLLSAARNEDPAVLDEIHLKAQLLFCGALTDVT